MYDLQGIVATPVSVQVKGDWTSDIDMHECIVSSCTVILSVTVVYVQRKVQYYCSQWVTFEMCRWVWQLYRVERVEAIANSVSRKCAGAYNRRIHVRSRTNYWDFDRYCCFSNRTVSFSVLSSVNCYRNLRVFLPSCLIATMSLFVNCEDDLPSASQQELLELQYDDIEKYLTVSQQLALEEQQDIRDAEADQLIILKIRLVALSQHLITCTWSE